MSEYYASNREIKARTLYLAGVILCDCDTTRLQSLLTHIQVYINIISLFILYMCSLYGSSAFFDQFSVPPHCVYRYYILGVVSYIYDKIAMRERPGPPLILQSRGKWTKDPAALWGPRLLRSRDAPHTHWRGSPHRVQG